MEMPIKVALVHDWLVGMRGGEKVLETLCRLFPHATLFTLVHRDGSVSPVIERMNIRTSFIQHLPFGQSHYRHYLPLFPVAANRLDARDFDLVISSSHAAAKSVRTKKGSLHICYCHTPMRYIWDQYDQYFGRGRASLPARLAMKIFTPHLRAWDVETATRVTHFIANSHNVQERIKRIYNRDSVVIHPPVDVQRFSVSGKDDAYYLMVSALVPYKRIDLAIEAFNRLGKRLIIVGSGGEEQKLKALAKRNIEFAGWVSEDALPGYYAGCHALVFPGEEDFGIVPLEAMASGKPVVAFGKGGALETVVDPHAGVLFKEQSVESLEQAVKRLDGLTFDNNALRAHAQQFDRSIFEQKIAQFVREQVDRHIR